MRVVVFLIIGAIAGWMAWLALESGCPNPVVASEAECVEVKGFDRAFCANAFARPEEAIYRAGNIFATQSDCQMRHPICIEYPGVHGWTPKPTGYCLERESAGQLARMEPVYGPKR